MDIKFTNILNQRQYSFHSFISLNTLRGRRFYNNYIIDILCLSKITDQKTTKYLKCRLLCETSWLNRTNYENVQTHEGESAHKNSNPSCFKLNLHSENTRWFFFSSFFSWSEESRAIWKPVYSSQISNWLANVNFYTVAMGYRVLWFDTELQTLLISSIQFCPSLCITEPSGHLFTNKPLMAQIFSGLSLWHGRKCLHLSTRLDVLLVSHHKASFTGEGNSEE